MAQLTDTTDYRPNLPKYQSRGITRQQPNINNPNAGLVHSADAKVWDAATKTIASGVEVRAKMDLMALDMEKRKMTAEMNDYYLDQQSAMKEGLMGIPDGLLNGSDFDDNYEKGKVGVKPYAFDESKYSQRAIEQMAPALKMQDDQFRKDTRDLFWGELVHRNEESLNNLENRQLTALSNQLTNYTIADHENKMSRNENIATGKMAFKKDGLFSGIAGDMMVQKLGILNNDMLAYRNLIRAQVEAKVLTKEKATSRIQNYGQKQGEIMFNNIASLDPDEALEMALNGDIKISKGDETVFAGEDMEDVVYTDPRITQYHLDKMKRDKDQLTAAKHERFLTLTTYNATNDPTGFLKQFGAWIPGAIKKTTYEQKTKVKGQKLVDSKYFTGTKRGDKFIKGPRLKEMTPGELVTEEIAIEHKYTDEDRKKLLGVYYQAMGKKYGFTSPQQFETAIYKAIMLANGEEKKANALSEAERNKQIRKDTRLFTTGLKGKIGNPNKVKGYHDTNEYYKEEDGRWIPREDKITEVAKHIGIDESEANEILESLVINKKPMAPGSGLGAGGMQTLTNALHNYWRDKILVSGATNINKDPMNDPYTFNLGMMTQGEKNIITEIIGDYREIDAFNNDRFLEKSSATLLHDAETLYKQNVTRTSIRNGEQVSHGDKVSRGFGQLWGTYVTQVLQPRIDALNTDANKVFLEDLKFEFPYHLPLDELKTAIPPDIRKKVNDLYELTGQDRTKFRHPGSAYWDPKEKKTMYTYSYVPWKIISNFTDSTMKVTTTEASKILKEGKNK